MRNAIDYCMVSIQHIIHKEHIIHNLNINSKCYIDIVRIYRTAALRRAGLSWARKIVAVL